MRSNKLNINYNMASARYSKKDILLRIIWDLCVPLFRFSLRSFFHWCCFLLKVFDSRIGAQMHIYNSATIYIPLKLVIGARKTWHLGAIVAAITTVLRKQL